MSKDAAAARRLRRLIDGYRATTLVSAAVELGLIERLATGPMGAAGLARELGLHQPSLERLLRGLVAIELVQRDADAFALGPLGRALADDQLAQDHAALATGEYTAAWGALADGVRSGEPAFVHAFGMTVWEHRQRHPELSQRFDRLMTRFQERAAQAVAGAFDFSASGLVVDVGGGLGKVLLGILAGSPDARGIVFDQPHVATAAEEEIAAAGLAGRCQAVGGSFLDSVPAGGDVYLLRHVLHNWDDGACGRILSNCREAMATSASSTLLVLESTVPAEDDPAPDDVLLDVHMLAVQGGRERSVDEYAALLAGAGFELQRVAATDGGDLLVATSG